MGIDNIFLTQLSLGGDGPTVAIKDCIDIAGYPTCSGSETFAEAAPAAAHADVVAHILEKSGRIVGRTNMHELAYGVTGVNRWLGTPTNPLYPDLIPGGSSSGSAAAVAAGLAEIGIGTDTGGSIRMPAACCGIFGLKPTFGRVSRKGCMPAKSSLDCVGPFARNVAGLETGMELIDPSFVREEPPKSVRLGLVGADTDVDIAPALKNVDVVPVELVGLDAAFQAGITIMAAECWDAFGTLTEDPRMGGDVRARLLNARNVTPAQVEAAERIRASFASAVDRALADIDALVLPTLPALPPALSELGDAARLLRLTALIRPFNLSGHPALTIPIDGPIGIQLVGRRGDDARLCAVAHVVANAL